MKKIDYTVTLGDLVVTASSTDLCPHANGAILMSAGDTVVLVTAVMGQRETNLPYFPLSVEFEEKFYAVGAILGSRFQRREGRPSDEAVLQARIIDRTIRPLFPTNLRRDVQIVVSLLARGTGDPTLLGVLGTSLALGISDIPWQGPVGITRIVTTKDGEQVHINPPVTDTAAVRHFDVLACGTGDTINMIEMDGYEIAEDDIVAVLEGAASLHQTAVDWQKDIIAAIGRPKLALEETVIPTELMHWAEEHYLATIGQVVFSKRAGKQHLNTLESDFVRDALAALPNCTESVVRNYFTTLLEDTLRVGAIEFGQRADGRSLSEVRPLHAEAGTISPVLHGSGLFYRGDTHVLSVLTLGGPNDAQLLDTVEAQDTNKRFMHHYNFPPFAVGEVGRVGGYNRRMIGHGALAEKALVPVLPSQDEFPYTIRLVSETISSNGSSSMASVCGSTLALMDGGVPIKKPVAGIASGIMMHTDGYAILTDIQGPEDEHGDMDFKVAGTKDGITAMQMDVKVQGVTIMQLTEALAAAKAARLQILDVLTSVLPAPRSGVSPRAPEIIVMRIAPTQIGLVIGGGGKTINKIKDESGVDDITIEDDGRVYITGRNGSATTAKNTIAALTKTYVVGERVTGTVTKLAAFGAFVTLDPYHDALLHISEIAPTHISDVGTVLSVGDTLPLEVIKVEEGKIGVSLKAVDGDYLLHHPRPVTT